MDSLPLMFHWTCSAVASREKEKEKKSWTRTPGWGCGLWVVTLAMSWNMITTVVCVCVRHFLSTNYLKSGGRKKGGIFLIPHRLLLKHYQRLNYFPAEFNFVLSCTSVAACKWGLSCRTSAGFSLFLLLTGAQTDASRAIFFIVSRTK